MHIASRLEKIKPSATLAVQAKALQLKANGLDVISLGAGEPDFDTPLNIKQAAKLAIDNGETKYTIVDGTNKLKDAIIHKFKTQNNLEYTRDQITVANGGKQVIFNLFLCTLEPGDEVIIPAPYWVSYLDIVNFADGTPVEVLAEEKQGFKITPAQLEEAITKKTKWLILCSPSNPTGAAYTDLELKGLAEVLLKYPNVNIMSDDIYEHVIFENFKAKNIAQICTELKDRTFIVNGVSKAYSMTGWRIGYGAGPKEIIKAILKLQSQSTTNPSSISQAAAVEALTGTQEFIPINNKIFQDRRDLVLQALQEIPGINCYKPEGAFYLFPSIHNLIGKTTPKGAQILNCTSFASALLEEELVAVVPGVGFGAENYFRISYATSNDLLKEACTRIKRFVLNLK